MMDCNHCSHLRRGEGGIRIGGRASLAMVPACPCAENLRLFADDEERTQVVYANGVFPGTNASNLVDARMCTTGSEMVLPVILGVTCDNYDLDEMELSVSFLCYKRLPGGGCSFFGTTIDGYAAWYNYLPYEDAPFTPYTFPGSFVYVGLFVNANKFVGVFTDQPVIRISYKFERLP